MFKRTWFGELKGKPINYAEFICDQESDLANLPTTSAASSTNGSIEPCGVGSIAKVTGTKGLYILGGNNQWVLFRG